MGCMLNYNKIIKYHMEAVCAEPLHIGNAVGSKEEVLIHPIDRIPFIQASGIAGIFRQYYLNAYDVKKTETLFGKSMGEDAETSRIRFTDGIFTSKDSFRMELRPRVSIDPVTGTNRSSMIKGTKNKAGHKFNMEYISAGSEFTFDIYLYLNDEIIEADRELEDMIAAMKNHSLQFGGQKSNGCGYVDIKSLGKICFDMKKGTDRKLWYQEHTLKKEAYTTVALNAESRLEKAYVVTLTGKTENALLVKGISSLEYHEKASDAVPMINGKGEYIIPGSSFKGAIRSQMEKIARYLHCEKIIEETFGTIAGENGIGNISFCDTVIGTREDNDKVDPSYRIHIDKFTGGVMSGSLFDEKNTYGNLTLKISIAEKNHPECSCALLLLALRDLSAGVLNLGSGFSVGKGFIDVDTIRITSPKSGREAVIQYHNNKVVDETGLVEELLASLQRR